jgi:hypothetical protein
MRRYAFVSAVLIAVPVAVPFAIVPSAPSFAVSAKDKIATCKFGADDQKLAGAARNTFMKKCMSNHDDPRGPGGGAPAATAGGPAAVPPPPKQ